VNDLTGKDFGVRRNLGALWTVLLSIDEGSIFGVTLIVVKGS